MLGRLPLCEALDQALRCEKENKVFRREDLIATLLTGVDGKLVEDGVS